MSDEELLKQIRSGNAQPVEMWLQLRGLIIKIARPFAASGKVELDDLLQESYFALLDALRVYEDHQKKFAGYAAFWFRQRFQRYLENTGDAIRVPVYAAARVKQYNKFVADYERDFGKGPTDQEIEAALGCSADQLRRDAAALSVSSLDIPVGEKSLDTVADLIEDQTVDVESEALEAVHQDELRATLWSLVDELPERQASTLRGRYQEGKTLKQCGDDMGITPEAVRQHELKALRRLRNSRVKRALEPYIDEVRYSVGVRSTGVGTYARTRTSSTELAAIKAAQATKQFRKKGLL